MMLLLLLLHDNLLIYSINEQAVIKSDVCSTKSPLLEIMA